MATATAAEIPTARIIKPDEQIQLRQSSRASKWDRILGTISEMELGDRIGVAVPRGTDPAVYRNTLSNAIYMRIRRPGLYPGYRFATKLNDTLNEVVVICKESREPKEPKAAKPPKRSAKRPKKGRKA